MKNLYEEYKDNQLWNIINKSIDALVMNKDLIENTRRDYIVGYLVKSIIENTEQPPARLTT